MITGYFAGNQRPMVKADVLLTRLNRTLTVEFLVDSGADGTVLASRDWSKAGLRASDFSGPTIPSVGVGGLVNSPIEPAIMRIRGDDRQAQDLPVDIEIQPRAPGSLLMPSFLGRDLLRRFTLTMSIERRILNLEWE